MCDYIFQKSDVIKERMYQQKINDLLTRINRQREIIEEKDKVIDFHKEEETKEAIFYTYCCPRCKSVLISLQVPFKEPINVHCQHCNSVIRLYGIEGSEPEIIRSGYTR